MADTTFIPTGTQDGLFGAGGGGLIGGLILGSLLRNQGNLFGGDGAGAAAGVATAASVNNSVATSAIQQDLGDIKAAIPLAESQVQTAISQANLSTQTALDSKISDLTRYVGTTTAGLSTQLNNNAALFQAGFTAMNNNLNSVENNITGHLNQLDSAIASVARDTAVQTGVIQAAISNDGDKTRALITHQYEASLNRMLSDANAQVIALQNRAATDVATRGVEVNTTNNINQMQQQAQQQQQYNQLANLIWGLSQSIRSNNEAINVGSGTMNANPVNTNTNIR